MGKLKQVQQLEADMFSLLESCYNDLVNRQKNRYELGLASLDILNSEYEELTGQKYVDSGKILDLYSKLWEF